MYIFFNFLKVFFSFYYFHLCLFLYSEQCCAAAVFKKRAQGSQGTYGLHGDASGGIHPGSVTMTASRPGAPLPSTSVILQGVLCPPLHHAVGRVARQTPRAISTCETPVSTSLTTLSGQHFEFSFPKTFSSMSAMHGARVRPTPVRGCRCCSHTAGVLAGSSRPQVLKPVAAGRRGAPAVWRACRDSTESRSGPPLSALSLIDSN